MCEIICLASGFAKVTNTLLFGRDAIGVTKENHTHLIEYYLVQNEL